MVDPAATTTPMKMRPKNEKGFKRGVAHGFHEIATDLAHKGPLPLQSQQLRHQ